MALGLCRRELVDRSTELGRPTTKAPIYGLGLQAEFRRELTSLFLSRSEQLIHSSSLAFPTTKDCTLKLSKDKPFLGLHCTQMFSPQQRKFLDNPLLSPTLLLSEFLLSFPRDLKWSFRFVLLPLNKMQWASWWLSIQLWIFKPKDSNYLLYVFLSTSSRHLH